MSVDSMAILILLGSFFLMIMLRFPIAYQFLALQLHTAFPDCVRSSSFFCILSDVSGTSSDHYLPADGKRNQFLQFNGSTFLHHHGMPYGVRWYF